MSSHFEATEIHPTDLPAITLRLHHLVTADIEKPAEPLKAVLLLHGASANHGTFTKPGDGLAGWLATGSDTRRRFDVWLLDWRGSSIVIDDPRNLETLSPGEKYNFNAAAEFDIRAAIEEMVSQRVRLPLAVIGHCMGGGILAEAIARGHLTEQDVDCIVLSTLGLFYETPIDSRMKSEDRVLERLVGAASLTPPLLTVDPRVRAAKGTLEAPWPDALENLFNNWPGGLFHEHDSGEDLSDERTMADHMCNRLSFMYGMVYNHTNLADEIHASDHPTLREKFGAIPLHMYVHAARNIRQGHATIYKPSDPEPVRRVVSVGDDKVNMVTVKDRNDSTPQPLARQATFRDADFISEAARARFRSLSRVTLITGALNRLWHRESVDLMHEWLCRGSSEFQRKVEKQIFQSYGHQDLLWGTNAPSDVFPTIEKGLTGQEPAEASISRHWRASHGMPSRDAATSPRR